MFCFPNAVILVQGQEDGAIELLAGGKIADTKVHMIDETTAMELHDGLPWVTGEILLSLQWPVRQKASIAGLRDLTFAVS